jgi:major membrane immunogen (membrane-anchored lipoprotein)
MKSIVNLMIMLAFILLSGCGQEDKPIKTTESDVFKLQKESMDKANQVEDTVLDAARQQRDTIDKASQ